jgi:hypothetical protein
LSTKNFSSTSSIPWRFAGSASGVMMVAKCSTESVTPGTVPGESVFRYAMSGAIATSSSV